MDTTQTIAMFIIAIVFFVIINRIFHVTYFGMKGFFFVFLCCMLAAASVVTWLFSFIANYYGWIIGVVVVISILVAIGKRKTKNNENNQTDHIQ
ncbi:hypothetical protein [Paenibacillus xylanexedens]|uniref:hypothetical protein n=1 Tax=Paenibacillus xylanexedens TaxID=528191 RepID=UPI0011A8C396|nr:hypothetical protein [Paenibacillus xylanexedens]